MNDEKQRAIDDAKRAGKSIVPKHWPPIKHKGRYTVRTLDGNTYMLLNCGVTENKALFILADKGYLVHPLYTQFEIELFEGTWRPMTLWKQHKLGEFGEIPAYEFRFFGDKDESDQKRIKKEPKTDITKEDDEAADSVQDADGN